MIVCANNGNFPANNTEELKTALNAACGEIWLGTGTVHLYHLPRGGNLEATHLHEIVDNLYLVYVLLRVLTYTIARSLRTKMRELRLPVAQETLGDIQHLCHLLDGVVHFRGFVSI